MTSESQQIQELRERYKGSMPEKANMLTKHLHALLDHAEPPQEVYDVIKDDVHKLAGSLGMYGYADLAKVARDAMSTINEQDADRLQHELLNLRNLLNLHVRS